MEGFFLYVTDKPDENYASFLKPDEVSKEKGLHQLAIYGRVKMDLNTKSIIAFQNNPYFIEFLHKIISKHAIEIPEVISAAIERNNGWLNIHDGRPNDTNDSNASIVGAFEVIDGKISKDRYQGNPNFLLLNPNGLFQIHPYLEKILYTSLKSEIGQTSETSKLTVEKLKNNNHNPIEIFILDTEKPDFKIVSFWDKKINEIPEKFKVGIIQIDIKSQEIIDFKPNSKAVDFLHELVSKLGILDENIIEAAKKQKEGWVYIIDGRTPTPQGDVPNEDIIGAFEVKKGIIIKNSYQKFEKHKLLNEKGIFGLNKFLTVALIHEIQNPENSNLTDKNMEIRPKKKGFIQRFFKLQK